VFLVVPGCSSSPLRRRFRSLVVCWFPLKLVEVVVVVAVVAVAVLYFIPETGRVELLYGPFLDCFIPQLIGVLSVVRRVFVEARLS